MSISKPVETAPPKRAPPTREAAYKPIARAASTPFLGPLPGLQLVADLSRAQPRSHPALRSPWTVMDCTFRAPTTTNERFQDAAGKFGFPARESQIISRLLRF